MPMPNRIKIEGSPQELFDKIVIGLRKQGKRSMLANPSAEIKERMMYSKDQDKPICAYRGDDGCKCAAGQIIPDPLYDEAFEGSFVGGFTHFDSPAVGMLVYHMQQIHDTVDPLDWEPAWANIAWRCELKAPA